MTQEYIVHTDRGRQQEVWADKFEIAEGGVLVFYENTGSGDTLGGSYEKMVAFKEWNEVERA